MKPDPKRPSHSPVGRISDDAEPTMAHTHMPVWLFVAFSVALFWAGIYLNQTSGGFNPQVYPPFENFAAVKAAQPSTDDPVARGAEAFSATCQLCHQSHGNGTPGQFPPLAGSEWVVDEDPGKLIRIVLNGLTGPIEVKGTKWDLNMTPFGGVLDDQQIADVASYVRNSWGNQASIVTPDQVKAIREATGDRPNQWTVQELLQQPPAPASAPAAK